jgi:hypothetical protein
MEPTFTKLGVKPRGPTLSSEYNKLNDDILFDLLRLYEAADNTKEDLERLVNLLVHENIFLRRKIENLDNNVNDLLGIISSYPKKKSTILPSHMLSSYHLYVTNKQSLLIDNEFRTVTLRPSTETTSRTHLSNSINGSVIVPGELSMEIIPYANGTTIIDRDLLESFNISNNYYWERTVVYPSSSQVDEEECLVIIKLPANIANNLYANSITIRPFPENSYDLLAIYYNNIVYPTAPTMWSNEDEKENFHDSMLSNGWKLIPGFKVDDNEQPIGINELSRTKWNFPDTLITQIVLRLRQRNWLESNNNRTFIFGAINIDVSYDTYNKAGGYAIFQFVPDMTSGDGKYTISKIRPYLANNDALSSIGRYDYNLLSNNCIYFDVYYERAGSLVKAQKEGTGYQGLLGSEKCWIVVNMFPDPVYKCTPVLEKVEIEYTTS